jgi:histidyl-tRNA synthetase
MKLTRVAGTQDIYSDNIIYFNHIIEAAKKAALLFNFQEINTPIFEYSDVFDKSLGHTSDIIHKEIYRIKDNSKYNVVLRPEFTAGIIRSIISNNIIKKPMRIFSHGNVFRHERPQRNRFRQFYQTNFEYIGYNNTKIDIEMISVAYKILSILKIQDRVILKVNTLGSKQVKQRYKIALQNYLIKYKRDFSTLDKMRLVINPIRIIDSKDIKIKNILKYIPKLYDFIDNKSKNNFNKLILHLKDLNINFIHDDNLVRGLDYYSNTVFEFTTKEDINYNTIIAGGRYDELIQQMGGGNIKGLGLAAGVERINHLMYNINIKKKRSIYIIPIGKKAEIKSIKLINYMRENYIACFIDYGISFRKRMRLAYKYNIKYILFYGNEELRNNECVIKNIYSGFKITISIKNISKYFKYI